jgi:hypothetical protein
VCIPLELLSHFLLNLQGLKRDTVTQLNVPLNSSNADFIQVSGDTGLGDQAVAKKTSGGLTRSSEKLVFENLKMRTHVNCPLLKISQNLTFKLPLLYTRV